MLKILTVPGDTEILRRKSRPILKFDEELAKFLGELGETLRSQKDPAGIGLSAIQVGNPIRVFATFLPETENNEHPPAGEAGETMSNEEKTKNKKQKTKIVFYINPEIVEHAAEMTLGEELTENRKQKTENKHQKPFLEGCLSIPRIYGEVLRYPWIKAKAFVLTEQTLSPNSEFRIQNSEFTLARLSSRVFQHELDHLNGILFTDHVLAQGNKLYREEGREMAEMEM